MSHLRNEKYDSLIERLNPARDRRARRSPRFACEPLEGRLALSSFGAIADESVIVGAMSADVPEPDPLDPPPDFPPYDPPFPPGGPNLPK